MQRLPPWICGEGNSIRRRFLLRWVNCADYRNETWWMAAVSRDDQASASSTVSNQRRSVQWSQHHCRPSRKERHGGTPRSWALLCLCLLPRVQRTIQDFPRTDQVGKLHPGRRMVRCFGQWKDASDSIDDSWRHICRWKVLGRSQENSNVPSKRHYSQRNV